MSRSLAPIDIVRQREAALREVLDLISLSRGDPGPVFDAIVHRAAQLCGAKAAALVMAQSGDSHQRMLAHYGVDPATVAIYDRGEVSMNPDISITARAILTGKTIHIEDMMDTDGYRQGVGHFLSVVNDSGVRTNMFVPLLAPAGGIGCIIVFRKVVKPYTDDEIQLVETFAAQAVIAIENVRQFRELQTRLAREAATREILEVISQSRDDDKPVFDVVLRKSAELCHASMANLSVISEDRSHAVMMADWGDYVTGLLPAGGIVWQMDSDHANTICMREGRVVHVHDLADSDLYLSGDPIRTMAVDQDGIRTFLAVPLFSGDRTVACISVYRREVRPFAPDEIALLETFAAQAVIAIENVRQVRELQTRLEREKASAEILEVISQSRDDDTPVFDMIAQSAARLCGAAVCTFWRIENGIIHYGASHGLQGDAFAETQLTPAIPLVDSTLTGQVFKRRAVARIEDATAESYLDHEWARVRGLKQLIGVPIFVGGDVWGSINLMWPADRAPREADIQLVESFAAQASIAIENVRQFRELQTRLAREAATREILEVISQSREDEAPVFDVVLRKAAELCGAPLAGLNIINEDRIQAVMVAHWGDSLRALEPGKTSWFLDSDLVPAIAMREGRVVQEHDLADTDAYRSGDPTRRMAVDEEGIRTIVVVPLFSGGHTIGSIALYRREILPFTADQIALVETFAAQAVIAIENVRQFRELQSRLEREKASAEILEVISQSRDDEGPVFDVILQNVARLCDTSLATFTRVNGPKTHLEYVAHWGMTLKTFDLGTDRWPLDGPLQVAQSVREGRVINTPDLAEDDLYRQGDPTRVRLVDIEGVRSYLTVPLITTGREAIGCIALYRKELKPFTADQVALVEIFAAQAVIAIENVRQFRELQTRLAREAATREILEVISRNPDDNRPVFDVILRNAIRLCGADTSSLFLGRKDDPRLTLAAWRDRAASSSVMEDEMIARTNATPMLMDPSVHVSARVIIEERNVHVVDVRQHPSYLAGEPSYRIMGDALGIRSALVVPLIDARGALGTVQVHRRAVRSFSEDEIALVETFAAQAVIAIENVRQFKALEALNAELGERVQAQVGEIERMGRLKRFLPAAVADTVISSGTEKMLSSHRALLGVLFCDIRGFTAFCETAEPEETIEVLQTYHEEMGRLINTHGAGVDHRMGDGIMVLFNDPLPCDDPAGDAVRLAMAMRARMAELCRGWKRMGYKLGFGLGASLGYATVGMVGFGGRFDYTASGTAINLASRLCDEAQDGEILISPRVRLAVEDDFTVESRGEISFKGIREPVEVFCVTGAA